MSVRVRVDLEAFGHPPEWMLIDPTQTPTLNDVIIKLSNKLGISSDIRMRLDGCLLPNEESVGLLQSGDLVEAVNHSEARPPSKRAKVESPPNEGRYHPGQKTEHAPRKRAVPYSHVSITLTFFPFIHFHSHSLSKIRCSKKLSP